MKRFLIWIALTVAILVLPLAMVRGVGALQGLPQAASMLDTGPCAQPCWHGIQPGKDTLDSATDLLREPTVIFTKSVSPLYTNELCWITAAAPVWHGCFHRQWDANPGTPINMLELGPPAGVLRLGDAITLFGEPVASQLCRTWRGLHSDLEVVAHIYFKGNIVVMAYNPERPSEARLDPDMEVRLMFYYQAQKPAVDDELPPWHGFGTPIDPRCEV